MSSPVPQRVRGCGAAVAAWGDALEKPVGKGAPGLQPGFAAIRAGGFPSQPEAALAEAAPPLANSVADSTHAGADSTEAVTTFTAIATDLTDSGSDLTASVMDTTSSVANLTEGVADLTQSVSGLAEGATGLTQGVRDLTESVTDLTQSGADLTQSVANKRHFRSETSRFCENSRHSPSQLAVFRPGGWGETRRVWWKMAGCRPWSGPPAILSIDNGMSGQLLPKIAPIANARAYEGRFALAAPGQPQGPWQNAGLFTNTRDLAINGLTPGQIYVFQVRAIGGSTGYSDWSDPVSHMSM